MLVHCPKHRRQMLVLAVLKPLPGSLFFLLEEDKCHPNPCKNGGVCTEANGQYVCTCAEGFKGINCQGLILFCSYIMRTATFEINKYMECLILFT